MRLLSEIKDKNVVKKSETTLFIFYTEPMHHHPLPGYHIAQIIATMSGATHNEKGFCKV